MRAIYISNNWISNGSCTVYSTYNAWGMAKNRIETHLFVRNVSSGDTENLLRDQFNIGLPPDLIIHRIEKRFKRANIDYYMKVAGWVKKIADEDTVVISRTVKVIPYLLMIKNRRFRIYYETHNFFQNLKLRDDLGKRNASHLKNSIQERFSLKKIDGLICLTETQKELWRQYVDLPIHVIYPGLISTTYRNKSFDTVNLAYTGSLDKGRGIEDIIEMAGHLPSNYHVYLFGGKKRDEVENLNHALKRNEVDHKVTVTGWLSQADLQKRLDEMHLGLLPLRNNFFNRFLTAPSKLFDYLSHSLPSVASPLPALEELVGGYKLGIITDWDRPEIVAADIVKLMSDMGRYRNICEKVYHFAVEHTWEKRGEKIVRELFTHHPAGKDL